METHSQDPTTHGNDPWTALHDELGDLRTKVSEAYRRVSGDEGPSEDEVREALGTLAGAWDRLAGSVSTALQDPEVRQKLRDAAGALATAIGRTITELGSELRDPDGAIHRSNEHEVE